MKKRLALILTFLMVLSIAGCTNNSEQQSSGSLTSSGVPGVPSQTETDESSQTEPDVSGLPDNIELSFTEDDFSRAQKQAELLTDQLVNATFTSSAKDGQKTLEPREINSFVLSSARYTENPDYLYQGFVQKDSLYQYPVKNVRQMVYEMFGIEDWVLEGGDVALNEEKQQFETGLEFGIGGTFSYEDLSSEVFEDTAIIETTFKLTDNIGFKGEPGWNEIGYYTIAFQMMRESERVFLRFIEVGKK